MQVISSAVRAHDDIEGHLGPTIEDQNEKKQVPSNRVSRDAKKQRSYTHHRENRSLTYSESQTRGNTNEENRKVRLVGHSRSMQGIIQKQNPKIGTRTKTKGEPVPGT